MFLCILKLLCNRKNFRVSELLAQSTLNTYNHYGRHEKAVARCIRNTWETDQDLSTTFLSWFVKPLFRISYVCQHRCVGRALRQRLCVEVSNIGLFILSFAHSFILSSF